MNTNKNFLKILKQAIELDDQNLILRMVKLIKIDIQTFDVFDESNNYDSLVNCASCLEMGENSICFPDHYSIGHIKIEDQFQKLEIVIDFDNFKNFLEIESEKNLDQTVWACTGGDESVCTFINDDIYISTDCGVTSTIKMSPEKMRKLRQEILILIKSWNIKQELFPTKFIN